MPDATAGGDVHPADPSGSAWPGVPTALSRAAAWAWRIIVVAAVVYGIVVLLSRLSLVTVPFFLALLLAALLHRPVDWLRRHHWPRALAAFVVLLAGLLVAGAVGYFIVSHVVGSYSLLAAQAQGVVDQLRRVLDMLPGGQGESVNDLVDQVVSWAQRNRQALVSTLISAGRVVVELATGLVLALFLTFFVLLEGDRIWAWLVRLLPAATQGDVNGAGHRAWRVLSGWIVGTAIIASIHGVVVGVVLWLLGTPLVVPLAVLVFVGSFIPIIGALLFGGFAVLVTLLTGGLVPALILVVVLVVENQLEGNVLQPLIIGKAVSLNAVAILVVLTGAGILAGLVGAIVAVPLVAMVHSAVKYLTGIEDIDGNDLRNEDRMEPIPPPVVAPTAAVPRHATDASDPTA